MDENDRLRRDDGAHAHSHRDANEQERYREIQHSKNDLEDELSETKKDDLRSQDSQIMSHFY